MLIKYYKVFINNLKNSKLISIYALNNKNKLDLYRFAMKT
jgi:hypothetical protein